MTRAMKDIRELKAADIPARLTELRKEHAKLNAQAAMGTPPKNPMQIRNAKRMIARLLTRLTEFQASVTTSSGRAAQQAASPTIKHPTKKSSSSMISSSPTKHATREAITKHE